MEIWVHLNRVFRRQQKNLKGCSMATKNHRGMSWLEKHSDAAYNNEQNNMRH